MSPNVQKNLSQVKKEYFFNLNIFRKIKLNGCPSVPLQNAIVVLTYKLTVLVWNCALKSEEAFVHVDTIGVSFLDKA